MYRSLRLLFTMITTAIFSLSLLNVQNCFSITQNSFTTKLLTTTTIMPSAYLDILSNNSSTIKNTFSTYENPIYGVKIQYPSHWQKMEFDGHYSNKSLLIAGFSTPSDNDSGVLENLVIAVKILPSQNTYLKQFVDSMISSYKLDFPNFQLIELNPLKTPALNSAYKIQYTHNRDMLTLRTMEVWTINGDKAYMISYNADPSDFSIYLPIIQRMIESFATTKNIQTKAIPHFI